MCMGSCASACAQQAGSARSSSIERRHQGCRDQGRETGERQSALTVRCGVAALLFAFTSAAVHAQPAAINQVHAGCVDIGARVRRLGCVAPRYGLVGVGLPRQTERAAGRRQGVPKPQCAALPRRRCQPAHAARRAERAGLLATGVLRVTQGVLGGYSGVTVGFGVQAFRLQGLSQSARAKAPFSPSHSRLSEY